MQMRNVMCAKKEGAKILRILSNDQCNKDKEMSGVQKCSVRPCQAGWYIYPWKAVSQAYLLFAIFVISLILPCVHVYGRVAVWPWTMWPWDRVTAWSRGTKVDLRRIFESAAFSFRIAKISPSTRSVFKSNSAVHTHPLVSGFTLEKLELHVMPPFRFLFGKRLDTSFPRHRIRQYWDSPSTRYRFSFEFFYCYYFHSGERIQKYPYSLPNSPDACGRKLYPERKSWGYKSIRLRVDRASTSEVVW